MLSQFMWNPSLFLQQFSKAHLNKKNVKKDNNLNLQKELINNIEIRF